MGFLRKNHHENEAKETSHHAGDYLLALDIGSEYVKALIAKKSLGDIEISGVAKLRQAPTNMLNGAIADIAGVVKCCEEALARVEEMSGVRSSEVVVGIAGELIKGNTATVRYRRNDPNKAINEDEMGRIIEQVQNKAGEQARRELAAETNNPDVELRLINSALVSLRIDGYKVTNPIGFKGKELIVQIYTAFAPLVHISAIERVCDELQLDLVTVAVEPFALCRACLGDELDSSLSCVVMDIGGGTTDIAVIDDGGVEGTKMFSIGGQSFTHQIAERLGLSLETAEKLKLLSDSPKMKPELRTRLDEALARNLEVWQSGVQLALEDFQSEKLPDQLLLCGGGAGLSIIPETLAMGDWYRDLAFSRRPIVNIINPEEVPGVKNITDRELDFTFITAIGLLRVGMDTVLGMKNSHDFKNKLARLLRN